MKRKFLILSLILLTLVFIYIQILNPVLEEKEIKTYLNDKWNVNLKSKDKLIIFKKNNPAWHGEQQKFLLIESTDDNRLNSYLGYKDANKINLNIMKRIIEIEDILEIQKIDRVDFTSGYDYKVYTNHIARTSSEEKIDWLYYISIKGNNKLEIFLIEDLNVVDLGIPRF